jgi:hypothetical protein
LVQGEVLERLRPQDQTLFLTLLLQLAVEVVVVNLEVLAAVREVIPVRAAQELQGRALPVVQQHLLETEVAVDLVLLEETELALVVEMAEQEPHRLFLVLLSHVLVAVAAALSAARAVQAVLVVGVQELPTKQLAALEL